MTAPPAEFANRPSLSGELRESPQGFAKPPTRAVPAPALDVDQPHDLLSELLRTVRLSGERIVEGAAAPPNFSMGFTGVGNLLFIDAGELALRIDGDPHIHLLRRGEIVLLPRGDAHEISDAGNRTDAASRPSSTDPESPDHARWLCGTFTISDPHKSHLLESLPAVIILRGGSGPALEGLHVARRMLTFEMRSPSQGSAVMVARILDVIFIQILRLWAASADAEPNWMAGAMDPHTGPALSAMHRDPGHGWTVDKLARACNLSRSAFAARFLAHVGQPPATYLAHVRLDVATDLLRDGSLPITLVAKKVGYTSDAAFSRAFKSRFGAPPAHWRRDAHASRRPAPRT
jgi:AraC-like DNA-binding protein